MPPGERKRLHGCSGSSKAGGDRLRGAATTDSGCNLRSGDPRRWNRGSDVRKNLTDSCHPEMIRRVEDEDWHHVRELKLLQIRLGVGLLFRLLSFSDLLAQRAGVFPIESFCQGFGHAGLLRVAD